MISCRCPEEWLVMACQLVGYPWAWMIRSSVHCVEVNDIRQGR
jgi:hypothetical protein